MNNISASMSLRPPEKVMRLKRLGSFHQSRLSFMRILTRRMACENWVFDRPVFKIDADGVGVAIYAAHAPHRTYSLIAFAHDLPDALRSDRVIADAWDATFTLFDGVPTDDDIARLAENVPLQEAGRISEKELSLSRANRSVRLWNHVIEKLSKGKQPDPSLIDDVGYLMRTTAVYGSGKFGAADWNTISDRPEMSAPFQAEMLSVYLTRAFVRDLVEHMASIVGGSQAVKLNPKLARRLGIGNSTGLGMAPFIINHPKIINNWIQAREEAIARVRSLETASEPEVEYFQDVLKRSVHSVNLWQSAHAIQVEKIMGLKRDIVALINYLDEGSLGCDYPWEQLLRWAENELSEEGEELVSSLILEPYGDLVDDLADTLADNDPDAFYINGAMSVAELLEIFDGIADWALRIDWGIRENCSRAWYVSEEKLEPRLAERFEEPIMNFEQPLAIGRDMARAYEELMQWDRDVPVAAFLAQHPEHRHVIRRLQIADTAPYAEIRDNTISADLLPINMLRLKLSFFGAIHFDPRSDRWVRIKMYANAPYPEELSARNADIWVYPEFPS